MFQFDKKSRLGAEKGNFLLLKDKSTINDCFIFMKNNNIPYLTIDDDSDIESLDIIIEFSDFIEGLSIRKNMDLSKLFKFTELKYLAINDNAKEFLDFSNFNKLERLSFTWSKKRKNIGNLVNLKDLHIGGFNESNLEILSNLTNLEVLDFISCDFTSLKGIGNLTKLKNLVIIYAHKLTDLGDIDNLNENLIFLRITKAKNLKIFENLAPVANLEYLILDGCGEMQNIRFIQKLRRLKHLVFKANVVDGDMTPCIGIGQDVLDFVKKPHFSHSVKEIKEINKKF